MDKHSVSKININPNDDVISLNSAKNCLFTLDVDQVLKPNDQGELFEASLNLPDLEDLVYFAPQKWWPGGGNRTYPFFPNKEKDLPVGGVMILGKIANDSYFLFLCTGGSNAYSWLENNTDSGWKLKLGHHGKASIEQNQTLGIFVKGTNPYQCFHEAWSSYSNLGEVQLKLREEKVYPDVFKKLGWCSWEEFKLEISEKQLEQAITELSKCPTPISYLLIDDGHQDNENAEDYFYRKLKSLKTHPTQFPNGFAPTMKSLSETGIEAIGLWLPFMGGMSGLSQDNTCGISEALLETMNEGGLFPKSDKASCLTFFNKLFTYVENEGFNFVKIDFLTFAIMYLSGVTHPLKKTPDNKDAVDNPYAHAATMYEAMEEVLATKNIPLMNCNGMNTGSLRGMFNSVVIRCSEDYEKGNSGKAKDHLFHSFASIPWLGQFAWGDHDMFHSNDDFAGEAMAVSKALSGGPIYLSDAPNKIVNKCIQPLCNDEGFVYRPLAPAAPLPESLFFNPLNEGKTYRVIAPLKNECASVLQYNLKIENPSSCEGFIHFDDYYDRNIMRQPYAEDKNTSTEEIAIWDHSAQQGSLLNKSNPSLTFNLEELGFKLHILSPVQEGFAIIGNIAKYLAPCSIDWNIEANKDISLSADAVGKIVFYSKYKVQVNETDKISDLGNGFFSFENLKPNKQNTITIIT